MEKTWPVLKTLVMVDRHFSRKSHKRGGGLMCIEMAAGDLIWRTEEVALIAYNLTRE